MPRRMPPRLESLESREIPSANRLFAVSQDVGSRVVVYEATGPVYASYPPGRDYITNVYFPNYAGTGRVIADFNAYARPFAGGVRLALGDVTGDGIEDLITAPASGGGPHIKVFDGAALLAGRVVMVREFAAFDPNFRGGTYLATGQIDPSTRGQEIIVSAGAGGGAHVRVFGLNRSAPIRDFFAFDRNFRGGVRVASADMNGDGRAEVIAARGPGGLPQVRVFDVATSQPRKIDEFLAYDRTFRGGVYVAAGELDGNARRPEIVTGTGDGSIPHVKVWGAISGNAVSMRYEFYTGDSTSRTGARVSVGNLGRLPDRQSIYVGDGAGQRGQHFTFSSADIRLHGFDLSQFITMMAAGYPTPPPSALLGFTETSLSLFDPFVGTRTGGLNLG